VDEADIVKMLVELTVAPCFVSFRSIANTEKYIDTGVMMIDSVDLYNERQSKSP